MRRGLRTGGRILGIALVTLVLLEALLQLGAVLVRLGGRDAAGEREASGAVRLLALGDSNTYGLYLEPEQAYPAVLERIWAGQEVTRGIVAVNIGHPGNNSSQILRALPANLARYEPDVVTLMVGVNDFWTLPVDAGENGAAWRPAGWLRRHSRVYKLAYMLLRQIRNTSAASTRPEVTSADPAVRRLEHNLRRIADTVGEHDARLVLITYPFGELQAFCNTRLRRLASERGLPLVDAAEAYANRCGDRHCDELLFGDNHPTAAGHEMIALALYDVLR